MNVVIAETKGHYDNALSVRYNVFVNEQNISPEEEIDQYEKDAVHFVAYDEDMPIGAGRIRVIDNKVKAERICVLASHRGKKVGQAIMAKIEDFARNNDKTSVVLNAQMRAVPFYKRIAYKVTSDEFMDAGIPHVQMVKNLV
ncbi:putative GNAT family N-acyltransferase [Scopulibacillus darangshiensis]|uniref:Putative GNAT family N-acyltransferase n=1 Tax=Scopulibacillus darangshiensis TaxID=442528 RepID=A0A4R2NEG4_9BACL|nr:GNAT family N-acetyltransferase [Scopulibacillus darangshiensis]TCP19508.1 putative GNAT family N-acyltransferase [Scopulibacillus darangshiensis]